MKTIKTTIRVLLGTILISGILTDAYLLFTDEGERFKWFEQLGEYISESCLETTVGIILLICIPVLFITLFVLFALSLLVFGWLGDLFMGLIRWIFTGKFTVADGSIQDMVKSKFSKNF